VCEQNDISTDACLSLSSLKKIEGGLKRKRVGRYMRVFVISNNVPVAYI
jgi:hypothetical protein